MPPSSRLSPRLRLLLALALCAPAAALLPAAAAAAAGAKLAALLHGAGHVASASAPALVQSLTTPSSAVAATQASLAGVAVTGAATSLNAVSPEVITDELKGSPKPHLRAVGSILAVEWKRLARAFEKDPLSLPERTQERAPIITWAIDLWARSELPSWHPWHSSRWHSARAPELPDGAPRAPTIWASLRALERELASQVWLGLSTAPLRVLRLLRSALLVTVVALVAQVRLPGFGYFRRRLTTAWPRLVDHLAETLDRNFESDPDKAMRTESFERPATAHGVHYVEVGARGQRIRRLRLA